MQHNIATYTTSAIRSEFLLEKMHEAVFAFESIADATIEAVRYLNYAVEQSAIAAEEEARITGMRAIPADEFKSPWVGRFNDDHSIGALYGMDELNVEPMVIYESNELFTNAV